MRCCRRPTDAFAAGEGTPSPHAHTPDSEQPFAHHATQPARSSPSAAAPQPGVQPGSHAGAAQSGDVWQGSARAALQVAEDLCDECMQACLGSLRTWLPAARGLAYPCVSEQQPSAYSPVICGLGGAPTFGSAQRGVPVLRAWGVRSFAAQGTGGGAARSPSLHHMHGQPPVVGEGQAWQAAEQDARTAQPRAAKGADAGSPRGDGAAAPCKQSLQHCGTIENEARSDAHGAEQQRQRARFQATDEHRSAVRGQLAGLKRRAALKKRPT